MTYRDCQRQIRRGATLPLTVILLIPLIAMVAFAVDVGWMVLTKTDLQHAADSAALAGAGPLMDGQVKYNLPGQNQYTRAMTMSSALDKAREKARNFANYNSAGGVSSLELQDTDIEFGFTDGNGNYTPQPTYTGYPNTIKVTLRRDTKANGPLALFFGPALGVKDVNLDATAAATIYTTSIDNFSTELPTNPKMLPITYDVNHWNNFLATGKDPDGKSNINTQGEPVIQVYTSIKFPGNFGLLSLNDSHVGASTLSDWIDKGMSKEDVAALQKNQLLPLSQHDSKKWDWIGDTGVKESIIHTLSKHIGEVYMLPLYTPLNADSSGKHYQAGSGKGSKYSYNIVQFVPVKIVSTGTHTVIVQPASMVVDFNTITSKTAAVPAGTSTSSQNSFFLPPKLSQ